MPPETTGERVWRTAHAFPQVLPPEAATSPGLRRPRCAALSPVTSARCARKRPCSQVRTRCAFWKLTTTCRWESGQRRDRATFVAARRRRARAWRRSAGSSPRWATIGGCKPLVRSMKRSLPRRKECPQGCNGEPSLDWAGEGHGQGEALGDAAPENPAAYEGAERWDSRRGNRRDPSPPRPCGPWGAAPGGGPGATSPISGVPAKRARAERESERPRVLPMPWTTEPRRRGGAALGRRARRG